MMAARQHTSTSTRKVDDPELKDTEPTIKLLDSLATLQDFAQTASKHRFKLGTHTHYGPKTHDALVEVRRNFLELRANYPKERHAAIAAQLDALEMPLAQVERGLELDARELAKIIREVSYRVGADLRAAIQAVGARGAADETPFITP